MDVSKTIASCPSCGAELPEAQNYCVSCGYPLDPPDDEPDTLLGATIADNFRLDSVLGEGAMGRVYKATQISLDKAVAIKVLHKHLAGDRNIVRRFHREARAASRLNHPNSLHIIDFGQTRDRILFIAMEYIEGQDLHEIISEDFPLTLERITDLIGQVCDALDEAHAAGIVHRDLKAENIMVVRRRDGREEVKVCDFGIAKIQDPGDMDASAPITVAGIVCGTPEYMSPEQCRGEKLDGRADVYSLGVLLYQLTTMALPFVADSPLGVVTRQLTDDPIRPTDIRPDLEVTKLLENVILRAMSKDRSLRYSSALDLKADLERVLEGKSIPEPPAMGLTTIDLGYVSPRRRVGLPLILGISGAGVVGAIMLALVFLVPSLSSDSTNDPTQPVPPEDQISNVAGANTHHGSQPVDRDASAADEPPKLLPTSGGDADNAQVSLDAEPMVSDAHIEALSEPPSGKSRPHKRRIHPQKRVQGATKSPAPVEPTTPQKSAFQLGREAYLSGNCARALTHFERARRASPGNADVHRMLGKCYMREGQTAQGRAAYRRYLELRPNAQDRAFVERIIGN